MSALQPHGPAGELREVDLTCSHVGVNAGDPWMLREHKGRKGGIYCGYCGVWWPGHKLEEPERRGHRDPDYRQVERDDDARVREPLPPAAVKPRREAAAWSNLK